MIAILSLLRGLFGGKAQAEQLRQLHEQIAAAPDDDAPRLALAKWYLEQGDPRGDFMRAQCEAASLPEHDERRVLLEAEADELANRHGKRWVKPLKELDLQPMFMKFYLPILWFRRGMIEAITIDKRGIIPGKAERLFELAPLLRRITFERCSPDFFGIAGSPGMSRIRGLDLSSDSIAISAGDLKTLLHSPFLTQLTELDLSWKQNGKELVTVLVQSPLRQLKTLRFSLSRFDAEDVARLAAWPGLSQLEELDLSHNSVEERGAQAIANSPYLKNLTALNLSSASLGSEGVIALAKGNWPQLRSLQIESNRCGPGALASLLGAPCCGQLMSLDLSSNKLGDEGLSLLGQWPPFAQLRELELDHNEMTAQGVQALLSSPHFPTLRRFTMSSSELGDDAAHALIACEKLRQVQKLQFYGSACSDAAKQALRQHFTEDVLSM